MARGLLRSRIFYVEVLELSSVDQDSLSSKHEKELTLLRKRRTQRLFHWTVFATFIFVALLIGNFGFFNQSVDPLTLQNLRRELSSSSAEWAKNLSDEQLNYDTWISHHGMAWERNVFNSLSQSILQNATSLSGRGSSNQDSFASLSYLFQVAHLGVLRVSFILIACWRLWLIVIGVYSYIGWRSRKPYLGADMLGQASNNKLFYSGVRIALENLNSAGAPELQVRGLACPRMVSETQAQSSELGQLLKRYDVANRTNLTLAAIILAHPSCPAYVARSDEESLLDSIILPSNISENTAAIIERALDLHLYYSHKSNDEAFREYLESSHEEAPLDGEKMSHHDYARSLQRAMHRVLTPKMQQAIQFLAAEHLATIILAYEAGKVLAYSNEGGKWMQRSNFPQLSARAVLHSVEAYPIEYDYDTRALIRRSLIYASRYTSFGPVKPMLNLSEQCRAARQLVELLMARPFELEEISNEVELYGLIIEAHTVWESKFFDLVMTANPDVIDGTYATPGNLFLMPVGKVIRLIRQCLTPLQIRRMEELVDMVHQSQRLRSITLGDPSGDNTTERGGVPAYQKVFAPFNNDELSELSRKYGVAIEYFREWSSLRHILNSFGWLGRRVGDYSVPESSVIYSVMKVSGLHPDANQHGLIGIPGMVPLRATRLDARWGKSWQNHFTQIHSATMAENLSDYEKLLRGEKDDSLDDGSNLAGLG